MDATHAVRISSLTSLERALPIGLALVPQYAVMAEAFLAAIATMPPGEAQQRLDDLLADNAELQRYVTALYYMPEVADEGDTPGDTAAGRPSGGRGEHPTQLPAQPEKPTPRK